jgi:hypothetical protein
MNGLLCSRGCISPSFSFSAVCLAVYPFETAGLNNLGKFHGVTLSLYSFSPRQCREETIEGEMRLINSRTFKLERFDSERDLPRYAILSHTWGKDEPGFDEWTKHKLHASAMASDGGMKIISACTQADQHGFRYLWCDTVCIDKSSSQEMTEVINSMFKWYNAQICFAYL